MPVPINPDISNKGLGLGEIVGTSPSSEQKSSEFVALEQEGQFDFM